MEESQKKKITVELDFIEGDEVQHITSKDKGVVIGWRCSHGLSSPSYLVSFSPQFSDWFLAIELETIRRTGFFNKR